MINEENGIEYVELSVASNEFTGVILDWALAMADPDLVVFSMQEHTYPGNAQKMEYCMDKHAVIVDLEWKLWIEGPKLRGRWQPTSDWGQLGPYIKKFRIDIGFDDDDPEDYPLEENIARRAVIRSLGAKIKVPLPLIEFQQKQERYNQ